MTVSDFRLNKNFSKEFNVFPNSECLRLIVFLALFVSVFASAQEKVKKEKEEPKEGWEKRGKISAIFNQSAFSNWASGGEDNFALNVNFNYGFFYTSGDFKWDNTIIAEYGFNKAKNSEFIKKTNDRLLLNSRVGVKTNGLWYFSAFIDFKTQFARGYKFDKDENGEETRELHTKFFSPGYLSFGPGMLWTKSSKLNVNIAPASARFTFVDSELTLPDRKYFGVKEGENYNVEFGLSIRGYAKFDVMENVTFENILFVYSDYLVDPQNIDIDYTLNIVMGINKHLSANISFQTIYDDNAFSGFQIRQLFGFGVNYGF